MLFPNHYKIIFIFVIFFHSELTAQLYSDSNILNSGESQIILAQRKRECKDVRDDLQGRAGLLVSEIKKSGMYPNIDPPAFKNGSEILPTDIYNCPENFSLNITFLFPQPGIIYFTTDGTDPRTWDLTGNVSSGATQISGIDTTISISKTTVIKARLKNSSVWSALQELKIIPENTSPVVITEINYDSEADFDTEDWVELYNNSDADILLAGWSLKDSNDTNIFIFGSQTILKSNSYMVVSRDTSDFKSFFPSVDNLVGNFDFKLSNDGDMVRIFSKSNLLIDSVHYDNETPWPLAAAGTGSTLELIDPDYDNTLPENWQASKLFGTPGGDKYSSPITRVTQEQDSQNIPQIFRLSQNYLNPFNPTTHLKYNIAKAGVVTLKIFNIAGQEITTLVNEFKNPGTYSTTWTAKDIASGIYLYQLRTKEFSATKKFVLIK